MVWVLAKVCSRSMLGGGAALLVSDGWRYCLGKGCGRRAMSEWVNVDELCFISPLPSPQIKEHLCTYRPIFMIARNIVHLIPQELGSKWCGAKEIK